MLVHMCTPLCHQLVFPVTLSRGGSWRTVCSCDRANFRATKALCQRSGLISGLKVSAAFALTCVRGDVARFAWRQHLDFNSGDANTPTTNYIITNNMEHSPPFGPSPSFANLSVFPSVTKQKQNLQLRVMADERDARSGLRLLTSLSAAQHKRLRVPSDGPWTCNLAINRIELGWKGDIYGDSRR